MIKFIEIGRVGARVTRNIVIKNKHSGLANHHFGTLRDKIFNTLTTFLAVRQARSVLC